MQTRILSILLFLILSLGFTSCGLYYRLHKTKAEKAQLKAERKKEDEWNKKQKIQEQNRKRMMAMQTKDTRKRMRTNKKKSDRINARKAPQMEKHFKIPRLFRPSRWWRK
jgi:sortase (surface protein transpeptidase)